LAEAPAVGELLIGYIYILEADMPDEEINEKKTPHCE
jgi:hypothetical protein